VAALRLLLRANAAMPDGLTVMLDSDDDYVVRLTYPLAELDADTFKEALHAAARAGDGVYALIKGSLSADTSSVAAGGTFSVPKAATEDLPLLDGRAALSFDPKKWTETTSPGAKRRGLKHESGDGYAVIVADGAETRGDQLRDAAIAAMREDVPDARVVQEQRRRVNGIDVLLLRVEGSFFGIPFTYLGYHYGGPTGTIHVVAYTSQRMFETLRSEFEDLLNGLRLK
jgi:hypothetical protein